MPAVSIIKEVTCVISGVLLVFNIDNPLTKLCPAKTTITVTSGTSKSTSTSRSSSHSTSFSTSHSTSKSSSRSTSTSTIFVGSSTSIVVPGSTLTVPTTSYSVPITTSTSTSSPSSSSVVISTSTSVPSTSSVEPTTSVTAPTSSSSEVQTTSSSLVSTSTSSSTSAATPTGYDAFNCPSDLPLSCSNTTAIADTCCFESPGGLILQTQFWDVSPATGPNNSWTIHGLWPDNCDGTYEQYCDPAREYTNLTQILQSYGRQDLVDYSLTYWASNSGPAETFWEHEFGKHGTCMSTFDTQCYPNYTPGAEVVDFFNRTISLFKDLPSYDWLAAAGIVPSTTVQYTLAQFENALAPHHGGNKPYVGCSGGQVDELWYYYYVQGSLQEGNYVPTAYGSSSCPASFWYYPKGYTAPTTTTSKPATSATATACSTASATPFVGKGYLNVYNSAGTKQGFVISTGKWLVSGTPATYRTSTTTGQGPFTLTTSKGLCAIQADSSLFCDSGVTTGTQFYSDGSSLQYNSSDIFSAASVPSGAAQGTIFAGDSMAVDITLQWQTIC
ncbi:Ribonuclease T2 precursor (RNase T2) [Elasticomyces elasticus]|nr:Ribonuclease T2 precursor (RNase T2) [Elasticomyces elasticus]